MKAVDTNIVLRTMTGDDPGQVVIADGVIAGGVFVPVTVLMEAGWVLGSIYRRSRVEIAASLEQLLDLPTVHVADEPGLRRALALYRGGADLADAIHLVAAQDHDAFITFDRDLARLPDPPLPIELAG